MGLTYLRFFCSLSNGRS